MSANALNPAVPFLVKVNTDLIVGAVIRNSDPAKEAARAGAVIKVAAALQKLNGGDVAGGLADIEAATAAAALDPAESAALATAISYVASKAAAVQQFLAGSITGALVSQIVQQVATEATAVAQKYLTPAAKAG